jgi:DNA-binding MarR family transcriptional regulator
MNNTNALYVALRSIDVFRAECRADIGAQTISCFLHISVLAEIPMLDLIEKLGVSGAAVSRNITLLGKGIPARNGKPAKPGLNLVESQEDEKYRRRKIVRLTAKGRELAAKLIEEIESTKPVAQAA